MENGYLSPVDTLPNSQSNGVKVSKTHFKLVSQCPKVSIRNIPYLNSYRIKLYTKYLLTVVFLFHAFASFPSLLAKF